MGTIAIGVALGYVGIQLSQQFELFAELIAPLILIIIGLVYLTLNAPHQHDHVPKNIDKRKNKAAIIFALTLSMFLSPCLEMESYFLVAAKEGWGGIILVSVVFLLATTSVMLLLVFIGFRSLDRFNWDFLEKNEKKISGIVLLLIGILTLLLQDQHFHLH
jgi:putative Mn2+ efflux pump MntP